MNRAFIYHELMVHTPRLLDPNEVLRMQESGLVSATFRRLDPGRQEAVANAILAEAFDRGPTQLRVRQVAAEARVSVGSLYQYFGNRDGLLEFAIELTGQRLATDLAGFTPALAALPLREGLQAWVTGGMEWSRQQAGVLGFFVRGAYEGDAVLRQRLVRPLAEASLAVSRARLAAAGARGEVRPGIDLDAAARAVNALLIALTDSQLLPHLNDYFRVGDEQVEFERTLAAGLDLVVQGLA